MKELVNSMKKIVLDIQDERKRKLDHFILDKAFEEKNARHKSKNLSKSLSIIYGLQTSLDFEKGGEIFLVNSHIASYKEASYSDHGPTDERKLLFNKKEVNKLIGKVNRDGFSLIPTKMYFKKGKAKVEVAIAKGKKKYDKRQTIKNRQWNRDKSRYVRRSS